MTSRRFETPDKAIANLQRQIAEIGRRASRIGHVHGPARRVRRTTSQSVINSTNTTVSFNSTDFSHDPAGDIAHSAGVFTFARPGLVQFSGGVAWVSNGTGNRILQIHHNAVSVAGNTSPAASGNTHFQNVTTVVEVAANDTLELVAFQSSGGNLNVGASAASFAAVEYLRFL